MQCILKALARRLPLQTDSARCARAACVEGVTTEAGNAGQGASHARRKERQLLEPQHLVAHACPPSVHLARKQLQAVCAASTHAARPLAPLLRGNQRHLIASHCAPHCCAHPCRRAPVHPPAQAEAPGPAAAAEAPRTPAPAPAAAEPGAACGCARRRALISTPGPRVGPARRHPLHARPGRPPAPPAPSPPRRRCARRRRDPPMPPQPSRRAQARAQGRLLLAPRFPLRCCTRPPQGRGRPCPQGRHPSSPALAAQALQALLLRS